MNSESRLGQISGRLSGFTTSIADRVQSIRRSEEREPAPTFEQVLGVLPIEPQPEYDELGRYVGEIARKSAGFDFEVDSTSLTDTQQAAFKRFGELSTLGQGLLAQEA